MLILIIMIMFLNETFSYRASNDAQLKFYGPDVFWGYDCPGNDLYQFESISMNCAINCRRTPGCTHVVWSAQNNHTCYLKKGLFSQKNLIKTNDTEIMCQEAAYIGDQDNPPEQINISTRYQWSCKNPVCSGSANILRSDNPVKLCYKDGYSPSDHGTPVKIGGFVIRVDASEHMCSNQQPWFVNDKLAYGYGSMKYYPTSDITYCCICYQLNFMNDLLKEKTMFIQIIDHDEMISNGDQLVDLFIPGSEDRVLGCKEQWNSYGPTYEYPRDVEVREECFNLPKGLQNGCLFKFDWLKNISNPNVTYTKVQCPKELIDISGCYQGAI